MKYDLLQTMAYFFEMIFIQGAILNFSCVPEISNNIFFLTDTSECEWNDFSECEWKDWYNVLNLEIKIYISSALIEFDIYVSVAPLPFVQKR